MSTVTLTDNPSNSEILAAIETIRTGGSVTTASIEPIDQMWPLAIVRYVNGLGPDTSGKYGVMAYERVATVANMVAA